MKQGAKQSSKAWSTDCAGNPDSRTGLSERLSPRETRIDRLAVATGIQEDPTHRLLDGMGKTKNTKKTQQMKVKRGNY